ncbi:MAG: hypothetical protein IAG10_25500 [Planctomycetaceae bacterium]|nr:hypothetical protein [Planctomycetaceae bacterium]
MVRAILTEGRIEPVEPLPESWQDGQELSIDSLSDDDTAVDQAEIERWHQERLVLSASLTETDHQFLKGSLDEQRQAGKELMRREMERRP